MLFNEIQRFHSETEFDVFTVSNSENGIFKYSLFGTTFFSRNQIPHKFWVKYIAIRLKTKYTCLKLCKEVNLSYQTC